MTSSSAQTYHAIGYRDALAAICMLARLHGPKAAIQQAAKDLFAMDPTHCHAQALLNESADKLPDPIDVIRRLFEAGRLENHFYAVRDSECLGWEGPRMLAWGKACEDADKLTKAQPSQPSPPCVQPDTGT